MQKAEQLRRRDPKAHTAMISARKESYIRQQYTPSHQPPPAASVPLMYSTQHVRWDAPMIATGDMLRPPSPAPGITAGTDSMLNRPLVESAGAASATNLDQHESGLLSSFTLKAGERASVSTPKQTLSSVAVPQQLSGTPKFTTHDLQNHIDGSVTSLPNGQVARPEEGLSDGAANVGGKGPSDERLNSEGLVPKTLQESTRREFQEIISRKSLEPRGDNLTELRWSTYARELQDLIVQRATTEVEYLRLALEVKHLLNRASMKPKALLKFLDDKFKSSKPKISTDVPEDGIQSDKTLSGQLESIHENPERATTKAQQHPGQQVYRLDPISGIDSHKTGINETMNGSQQDKGERKRCAAEDDEHPKKKIKSTSVSDKIFVDLLRREAARDSPKKP